MKIYVDYDTTLINLIDPWVDWVNSSFNVNVKTSDINRWYYLGEEINPDANNFWKRDNHYVDKQSIKPFSGAIDFFNNLQSSYGKENVIIISSTRDHHIDDKINHMQYYFNVANEQILLSSKEKHIYTQDGVLIDDYPVHVMEHIHYNNLSGIIFNENRRFGWSRPENYHLDNNLPVSLSQYNTLDSLYQDINKQKLSLCLTYDEILNSLKNIL